MANPLLELKTLGQSVWYDNIDRAQLTSGQFKRMLDEDGVVGVTANPTIFEKSISSGHAYDDQISQLINEGKTTSDIYEAVVIQDIRSVADLLRPIYDNTVGQDGYVSLEVSPDLALDTEGTIAEARRFWQLVDRPNLMIKIPATPEGIPAIYETLRNGINVNITLIFSIEVYRQLQMPISVHWRIARLMATISALWPLLPASSSAASILWWINCSISRSRLAAIPLSNRSSSHCKARPQSLMPVWFTRISSRSSARLSSRRSGVPEHMCNGHYGLAPARRIQPTVTYSMPRN